MKAEWNSTEAYDLSLYEEVPVHVRPEQPIREVKPAVRKKVSPRAAAHAVSRSLAVCGVLLVALIVMVLYHNVHVVELGDEIQTQMDTLASLRNEYSYLQGKLTSRTVAEVDSYAVGKRLCKVQDYQVAYIQLNSADQAYRTQDAPTGSLIESVMDGMDTILEYLKIK